MRTVRADREPTVRRALRVFQTQDLDVDGSVRKVDNDGRAPVAGVAALSAARHTHREGQK